MHINSHRLWIKTITLFTAFMSCQCCILTSQYRTHFWRSGYPAIRRSPDLVGTFLSLTPLWKIHLTHYSVKHPALNITDSLSLIDGQTNLDILNVNDPRLQLSKRSSSYCTDEAGTINSDSYQWNFAPFVIQSRFSLPPLLSFSQDNKKSRYFSKRDGRPEGHRPLSTTSTMSDQSAIHSEDSFGSTNDKQNRVSSPWTKTTQAIDTKK